MTHRPWPTPVGGPGDSPGTRAPRCPLALRLRRRARRTHHLAAASRGPRLRPCRGVRGLPRSPPVFPGPLSPVSGSAQSRPPGTHWAPLWASPHSLGPARPPSPVRTCSTPVPSRGGRGRVQGEVLARRRPPGVTECDGLGPEGRPRPGAPPPCPTCARTENDRGFAAHWDKQGRDEAVGAGPGHPPGRPHAHR